LPRIDAPRERAGAIHKTARGTLVDYTAAKSTAVKDVTADAFWKTLNQGGCWMDDSGKKTAPERAVFYATDGLKHDDLPLSVVAAEPGRGGLASPLMSKLERESNLRLPANRVAISPADARASGIEDCGRCVFETACGRLTVVTTIDAGVPAGVVEVAGGARMDDLCGAGRRARVVRA